MRSRPTHFHDGRVKRYSTYFILDPLYSERNERFVENLNTRVKKLEIIFEKDVTENFVVYWCDLYGVKARCCGDIVSFSTLLLFCGFQLVAPTEIIPKPIMRFDELKEQWEWYFMYNRITFVNE